MVRYACRGVSTLVVPTVPTIQNLSIQNLKGFLLQNGLRIKYTFSIRRDGLLLTLQQAQGHVPLLLILEMCLFFQLSGYQNRRGFVSVGLLKCAKS